MKRKEGTLFMYCIVKKKENETQRAKFDSDKLSSAQFRTVWNDVEPISTIAIHKIDPHANCVLQV